MTEMALYNSEERTDLAINGTGRVIYKVKNNIEFFCHTTGKIQFHIDYR